MKKNFLLLAGIIVSVCLNGCGYHVGSLMHPQIKTIAVAPVVNDTLQYNVSAILRNELSSQFMFDGSVKVVSMDSADCILYVRVTQAKFSSSSWSTASQRGKEHEIYQPVQWSVSLSAEYSLVLPGRGDAVLKGESSGSATFDGGADLEMGRISAVKQASYELAKSVVSAVTEGW